MTAPVRVTTKITVAQLIADAIYDGLLHPGAAPDTAAGAPPSTQHEAGR